MLNDYATFLEGAVFNPTADPVDQIQFLSKSSVVLRELRLTKIKLDLWNIYSRV